MNEKEISEIRRRFRPDKNNITKIRGCHVNGHKENRAEEPLAVNKDTVKNVLKSCGASETHIEAFEAKFDGGFGADTE